MSRCSPTAPFVQRKKHGTFAKKLYMKSEIKRVRWISFRMNVATADCCPRVQERLYAFIWTMSRN